MSTPTANNLLEHTAANFRNFAPHCREGSPLYERLAWGVADDLELLALAAQVRPGQPASNMLLGAVHYLLLNGAQHPLAAFYPSIAGENATTGDPFPLFRDFCFAHSDEIRSLLNTRITQTNEVRRCAYLLPAFALAQALLGRLPLALMEIGASAGLNLCWDRYGYDYGEGRRYGVVESPVQITTALRGAVRPPIPETLPPVAYRVGIDLNPMNTRDPDAMLWLRALVWPEQQARAVMLREAITLAHAGPPPLIAGDALDLLPDVLAAAPPDTALCIYHTHVTYQFTAADRERLAALIAAHAAQRDLCYVAAEHIGAQHPSLILTAFIGGVAEQRLLATTTGHANWIDWVDMEGRNQNIRSESANLR